MYKRLGKYLLLKQINHGGMGDVYLAKAFGYGGVDQIVALKIMRPERVYEKDFIQMFVNEAKLLVLLNHENISQIFELGRIENVYFISMEYIFGCDLRALIDRAMSSGIDIPTPLILYLTGKICEGLDYAHNKAHPNGAPLNIVHRDVSPKNILISYGGEVKLVDFGIAKASLQIPTSQVGILKGKYGYMSPEQIRGYQLDHRSDIFTVGILLWEMLAKRPLFCGTSDFSIIEKVRNNKVLPLKLLNPKIDPDLESIVMDALATKPEDRFQTAAALNEELTQFMLTRHEHPSKRDLSTFIEALFAPVKDQALSLFREANQIKEMPAQVTMLAQELSAPKRTRNNFTPSTNQANWENIPVTTVDIHSPTSTIQDNIKTHLNIEVQNATPKLLANSRRIKERRRDQVKSFLIIGLALFLAAFLVLTTWYYSQPSAALERGGIVVISQPHDATVFIDGVKVGITPYSTSSLASGIHKIVLKHKDYSVVTRHVYITRDQVLEIHVDFKKDDK